MIKSSIIYNCLRRGATYPIPFLFLFLVLAGSGCKKSDDPYSGAQLVVAPEGFYVVDNSFQVLPEKKQVNFEREEASFQGEFSHEVSWKLSLKGLSSGAEKILRGVGDHLNPEAVKWNGGHDGMFFFRRGEKVLVELSFMGTKLKKIDTITVTAPKLFASQGIMLSNDENRNSREGFEGIFNFNSATWTFGAYPDPAEQIFFGQDPMESESKPVQGENAVTLHGRDRNNNYFVTGIKRALTAKEIEQLPKDPDSVYINIFIYGRGNAATKMNVACEEADDGGKTHIENRHDGWEHQLSFNHEGWKLISIRYSDLKRSANTDYGGNGNNKKEPHLLRNVGFNLISSPPGNEVKATFDFPIITFGKPFNGK